MRNKLKLVLVAATTIFTASAAYAGPHHWANGNWGYQNSQASSQNVSMSYGQGYGRHHNGYHMGQGAGWRANHRGYGYGYNADRPCPYNYR